MEMSSPITAVFPTTFSKIPLPIRRRGGSRSRAARRSARTARWISRPSARNASRKISNSTPCGICSALPCSFAARCAARVLSKHRWEKTALWGGSPPFLCSLSRNKCPIAGEDRSGRLPCRRRRPDPAAAPLLCSFPFLPPPPSQSDPFDFILEECGRLSLSQEAHLRNAAPFLRQEKLNPANLPRDERGLGYHILYRVFGFENPHHHRSRRPPYTDAEAAELALSDYFLALGPRRVHLLQTPPKDGKQARGAGTRAAAPEGMPPPAEVPPSRRLGAAAATPAAPAEGGKDKLAGMKRARDDFSKPPRSLSHHSHAAGERSSMGKKTCANPDPVNPPAGRSSPGAGVTSTGDAPAVGGRPPSADDGGRRHRNLPPSILCPDDWEDARTTGYERGSTRLRPVPPPPQVDQRAKKGKAPAAGAVPCPSSSLNARTSSSADAAGVTEPGLEKGGASGRPSSSSTATVPVPPPPSARREAASPSAVGSDGDSLSAFIEALVRFSNRPKPPNQTQEKADPLEALAKGAFSMPAPKWWRPGGYGGRPDK